MMLASKSSRNASFFLALLLALPTTHAQLNADGIQKLIENALLKQGNIQSSNADSDPAATEASSLDLQASCNLIEALQNTLCIDAKPAGTGTGIPPGATRVFNPGNDVSQIKMTDFSAGKAGDAGEGKMGALIRVVKGPLGWELSNDQAFLGEPDGW
ncbi:hypothetical protein EK21DRAFT_111892 [Setomelanomma holmii]|uniref:Uncharacterized protein n=1 Tax=Setomelanomma holmii TaxID=210430 RepID=A0A9P4HBC3_9PLEO|nr:hypothetical protein EK21DRAFT_111892 [Setomelanomma holmii]